MKNILKLFSVIILFSVSSVNVISAEKVEFLKTDWTFKGLFGKFDRASLQRGYQVYTEGKTKTYKEIAINIGHPNSARAVANACGRNPYPVLIPCHRVIRSDGSLGGFSAPGGIKLKKKLLKKEGFSL